MFKKYMKPCSLLAIYQGINNKIHTAVKRNFEEILEVKTFLKMSIRSKCRGPKVELRF